MRSVTEAWMRNPRNYIRECAELLVPNLIYDRGSAVNYRIEPYKQVEAFYPAGFEYRLLIVENELCHEFRRGQRKAIATYPVWSYTDHTLEDLERLIEFPLRSDQEHRVLVDDTPSLGTAPGKQLLRVLTELQEEHPEVVIHLHMASGMTGPLGAKLGAIDMNPRQLPAHGGVLLPNGRFLVNWKDAEQYQAWMGVVGTRWEDIQTPAGRCKFSMRSFMWAVKHYNSELRFALKPRGDVDPEAIEYEPVTSLSWVMGPKIKPIASDKIICDQCTVAKGCRLYRANGVCAIPGTEAAKLAKMYRTRNSDQIIDAQAELAEFMVERAVTAANDEKVEGAIKPEVTKALKDAFEVGTTVAKLVNPALARAHAGGTNVVMINGRPASHGELNAAEVASWAFSELIAAGVDREDIDAEMVGQFIANHGRKAIEASASEVLP
jgi:hypothetical protein